MSHSASSKKPSVLIILSNLRVIKKCKKLEVQNKPFGIVTLFPDDLFVSSSASLFPTSVPKRGKFMTKARRVISDICLFSCENK